MCDERRGRDTEEREGDLCLNGGRDMGKCRNGLFHILDINLSLGADLWFLSRPLGASALLCDEAVTREGRHAGRQTDICTEVATQTCTEIAD